MQKNWAEREIIAGGIFLAALLLRLIFVWQWSATPYGALPIIDAHAYDLWGWDIASGHLFRDTAFYQSPLYPYVLALIYAIFGYNLLAVSLFNALLSALTCVILGLIAFDSFGPFAALATGALAVFDRHLIFYAAPVMKESLCLFLIALFLMCVLRALRSGRGWDFFLSGAWLGLAALTRGNALLLAPAVLLLAVTRQWCTYLAHCVLFTLGVILFILPATIHNAVVSHDFVPLNYEGGYNFYIGNSPMAHGSNIGDPSDIPDPIFNPLTEEKETTRTAERASGHKLSPSGVSAFWRDQALDFIRKNPVRFLSLLRHKLWLFWNDSNQPDNYDINFIAENFSTVLALPLSGFWFVSVASIFSIVTLESTRRDQVVPIAVLGGAYMVSVLLFYMMDRFRLPIMVFLLPLAGAALPSAWELIKSRRWVHFTAGLAGASVFLWVGISHGTSSSALRAADWDTLSSIESDLGNNEEADRALRKAIATAIEGVGTEAWINGVSAEERLGQLNYAGRLLLKAIQINPQDGMLVYDYGRLGELAGDAYGALAAFQKATNLAPSYPPGFLGLSTAFLRIGDRKHAVAAAQRGLDLEPTDPHLTKALAKALADAQAAK
jgi:4-amino-4-deoxy-L-arabinose transferase-like glycosyltransferase